MSIFPLDPLRFIEARSAPTEIALLHIVLPSHGVNHAISLDVFHLSRPFF